MDEETLTSKEKEVYEKLKTVVDPELNVNLVDLGLIYDIKVEKEVAIITMTLTIMGCPLTEILNKAITDAVCSVTEVTDCQIKLVWYPQWTPKMMSRTARLMLGVHS